MTVEPLTIPSYVHDNRDSIANGLLLLNNFHDSNGSHYEDVAGGGELELEGDGDGPLNVSFSMVRLGLAVFGVLANSITAIVLVNRKIWSPTALLLLTLVAYDALFLLASIPLCVIGTFVKVDMHTYALICGVVYPIRYMAQTGSIYTTVTLTIERFMIVLRPLKARVFCTFGKMKRLTLAVAIFSIIFNTPRCFFYTLLTSFAPVPVNNSVPTTNVSLLKWSKSFPNTVPVPIGEINGSLAYVMVDSEAVEEREFYTWLYTRVYELYVSGVFFYLLPYALIPILNLQLLLAIKRRRDETRRISVKSAHQIHSVKATDKEDGLTMIVLGITVCFFICCLVPAVYNVTQIAETTSSTTSDYLTIASDTMLCLNASTDFFFYCLLGRRFRTIFLQLFCCRPVFGRSHSSNGNARYNDTCYQSV